MVKELPAIGAPSLFFGMLAMYMLPTIEAHLKKHPNIASISVLNLFLGWTLVGWVLALVWVLKKPEA